MTINDDAFQRLLMQNRSLIFSVCRRYGCREADADDLLQEVTIALWQRREVVVRLGAQRKQAAYVWRMARSTCIDHLRRIRSEPVARALDKPSEGDASAEIGTIERQEGMATDAQDRNIAALRRHLHELIATLTEPDRTIVRFHLEGFDYQEIADRTGLSKSNVGVRLMRAKARLKEMWEE